MAAQYAHTCGVEGADPYVFCTGSNNIINSLTHFSGSFIGKGNGKDVPRVDAIFLNQIGDTVCQYTGFAGPCTC